MLNHYNVEIDVSQTVTMTPDEFEASFPYILTYQNGDHITVSGKRHKVVKTEKFIVGRTGNVVYGSANPHEGIVLQYVVHEEGMYIGHIAKFNVPPPDPFAALVKEHKKLSGALQMMEPWLVPDAYLIDPTTFETLIPGTEAHALFVSQTQSKVDEIRRRLAEIEAAHPLIYTSV